MTYTEYFGYPAAGKTTRMESEGWERKNISLKDMRYLKIKDLFKVLVFMFRIRSTSVRLIRKLLGKFALYNKHDCLVIDHGFYQTLLSEHDIMMKMDETKISYFKDMLPEGNYVLIDVDKMTCLEREAQRGKFRRNLGWSTAETLNHFNLTEKVLKLIT